MDIHPAWNKHRTWTSSQSLAVALTMDINTTLSCLDDLSIAKSEILKSQNINVWEAMSDLNFSEISFMNMGVFVFGA